MAQLINITSEALQATIRRLLPSQQGFGEDLQATNVVTPIIDLTPTAEGSQLPYVLSSSLSLGNQFAFSNRNNSSAVATSPGFFRLTGCVTLQTAAATNQATITISDAFTSKVVWQAITPNASSDTGMSAVNVDLTFFLDTGETLTTATTGLQTFFRGSIRQVADRYGNIGNPVGFTFE